MPLLALLGCASPRTCEPDPEVPIDQPLAAVARSRGDVHILALSGGGAHGAFGAGLLFGWRDHPAAPRPRFDVVTGVSTGALLATHAFLGEPADDVALRETYTTVETRDILRSRWFPSLLWSNSLAKSWPLERLIAARVPDETIDRVAIAGASGRRLYVATTNLDEGRLKIWDLTALAAAGDYARYRAALLASASMPVVFPPVDLNGALHVDGGAREQVFIRRLMVPLLQVKRQMARADDPGGRVFLHVVVNGKLGLGFDCVSSGLLPIAARSVACLADAGLASSVASIESFARNAGAVFRLARIPDATPMNPDALVFDKGEMAALYQAGIEFGRTGAWENKVPEVEDATRVMRGVD